MKILFVEKRLRIEKLGVCYLAAVLKRAGHEVTLMQDEIENVDAYLNEEHTDFVMFSITSDEAEWARNRNKELKKRHSFKTVVGGPHPTFAPSWGTNDEAIDYVVQGPGEDAILDIVNGSAQRLTRGNLLGRFSYISPDRSIVYKYPEFRDSPMKRFVACRYCLFSCRHCFNSEFKTLYTDQKDCLAYRPPAETIISEIEEVKQKYGLELAVFNDDDIANNPEWLEKFCKLFKKNAGVKFVAAVRATSVTKEIVQMMAKAGWRSTYIGLESANPKTQKLLRRGPVTNSDIYNATRWCEEAGVRVRLQIMIGLPVENPLADALETYEFALKCAPTDVSPAIYSPLPGTALWKYCVENNFVDADTPATGYFFKTVLRIPDAEKINRLGKLFAIAFCGKWPVEKLQVALETPISDEQLQQMAQKNLETGRKRFYGI